VSHLLLLLFFPPSLLLKMIAFYEETMLMMMLLSKLVIGFLLFFEDIEVRRLNSDRRESCKKNLLDRNKEFYVTQQDRLTLGLTSGFSRESFASLFIFFFFFRGKHIIPFHVLPKSTLLVHGRFQGNIKMKHLWS